MPFFISIVMFIGSDKLKNVYYKSNTTSSRRKDKNGFLVNSMVYKSMRIDTIFIFPPFIDRNAHY